ncbi:PREDICTED: uncharacterized protein LOC109192742 [Ipomoea nil]|uniref:uncharacterized protein LOC109192742 n=1 Tax=Ipomoea nil TaxID=35883 RepID=UPI000900C547|nr:PREDICTED: uncharacterized protein LOC109192742 [Ipomoea nil]
MGVFGDLEEEKKNDNEEGKLPKLPENDNEFLLSGAQIRLSSTEESERNSFEEESVSPLLRDVECPPLSPSLPKTAEIPSSYHNIGVPSSPDSDSSSEMSSIYSTLSPYTEREVCSAQGRIEEKVASIAEETGFQLDGEARYVLGQWVHGESSDPSTLRAILKDLNQKKEQSEWFEEAIDAWSHQFVNSDVPSPLEGLDIHPPALGDLYFSFTNPSFFMLLTLSLVLLLLYFVTKRMKKKMKQRHRCRASAKANHDVQ